VNTKSSRQRIVDLIASTRELMETLPKFQDLDLGDSTRWPKQIEELFG
jgi:hypothetical protein